MVPLRGWVGTRAQIAFWPVFFLFFGALLGVIGAPVRVGMATVTEDWPMYVFGTVVAIVCYVCLFAIRGMPAFQAVRGARQRSHALHDQPNAYVPAALGLAPIDDDEFARNEDIRWSSYTLSTRPRALYLLRTVFSVPTVAALVLLPLLMYLAISFADRFAPQQPLSSLPTFLFLSLVFAGRLLPQFVEARRVGVRVSREGVRQLYAWGQGPLLRWEDARLCEVAVEHWNLRRILVFSLHSQHTHVAWSVPPWRGSSTMQGTTLEMAEDLSALLSYACLRTGLTPLTLDARLAEADPEPGLARRYHLATGLAWLLAMGFLVMALDALVLPLTGVGVLDTLVAAICLACAVVLVVGWLWLRRTRWMWHATAQRVPLPAFPDGEARDVSADWRSPRSVRLLLAVLIAPGGALLLVAFYALTNGMLDATAQPPLTLETFSLVLFATLVMFAGMTAITVVSLVLTELQPHSLYANSAGVEVLVGTDRRRSVPWTWVQGFYRIGSPEEGTYVLRTFGGYEVRWPASATGTTVVPIVGADEQDEQDEQDEEEDRDGADGDINTLTSHPAEENGDSIAIAATPITARDVAALVAARTGLALRVKRKEEK